MNVEGDGVGEKDKLVKHVDHRPQLDDLVVVPATPVFVSELVVHAVVAPYFVFEVPERDQANWTVPDRLRIGSRRLSILLLINILLEFVLDSIVPIPVGKTFIDDNSVGSLPDLERLRQHLIFKPVNPTNPDLCAQLVVLLCELVVLFLRLVAVFGIHVTEKKNPCLPVGKVFTRPRMRNQFIIVRVMYLNGLLFR